MIQYNVVCLQYQYYTIDIANMKALFIIGPSGSGKTTLSDTLTRIYRQIFGQQSVTLVSLDAANYLSQGKDIQINQLITIEDVMEEYQIGPNGAILYAADFLYENIDWLINKLKHTMATIKQRSPDATTHNHLFVFDLPGQIQLYINSQSMRKSIERITKLISDQSSTSPCLLQLFDCTYMHDVNQFISLCMMSLSTMINMEMPHVNILNKIDIIKSAQNKPSRGLLNQYFRLNSATQIVHELKTIQDEDKVTTADLIAKVIDTYGQVSFMPCSIYQSQLIANLVYELQKIFGTLDLSCQNPKFTEFIKEVDDFAIDRAITKLENQYYQNQENDMQQFEKDLTKQNNKL